MKILFIAPLPPPVTGQSVACELLLSNLESVANVAIIDLSKRSFQQGVNSMRRILEVFNIIWESGKKNRDADLVYFTVSESVAGNLKDLFIFASCWGRLDKMVIHLHGGAGMREIMVGRHSWLRGINVFFLRRMGAVIVLGDRLKSIYEGVVPESRLHAVPNFAKDEFFVSPSDIDKKFANVEPLRLLFLSNLLPGKGHEELLTALAALSSDECVRFQVDFAGGFESPEDEVLFRQKAQSIKDIKITVHGTVHGEVKRDLLRKAHLFCLPTYYPYEGQPISILEAYASGCSVITTDHSGIFDTFTPDVNGVEVKPRSPESIANALQYALNNSEKLFEQAKTNHQHALSRYRPTTHVKALRKVFSTIEPII